MIIRIYWISFGGNTEGATAKSLLECKAVLDTCSRKTACVESAA